MNIALQPRVIAEPIDLPTGAAKRLKSSANHRIFAAIGFAHVKLCNKKLRYLLYALLFEDIPLRK